MKIHFLHEEEKKQRPERKMSIMRVATVVRRALWRQRLFEWDRAISIFFLLALLVLAKISYKIGVNEEWATKTSRFRIKCAVAVNQEFLYLIFAFVVWGSLIVSLKKYFSQKPDKFCKYFNRKKVRAEERIIQRVYGRLKKMPVLKICWLGCIRWVLGRLSAKWLKVNRQWCSIAMDQVAR